jgi:hypothetical protein
MYPTASLVTRFARNSSVIRSETPLSDDQMRYAAPSIFAEGKHASRSERYTYIPTIDILRGLRKEGFEPFMVAQGASRIEGKAAYTKHMVRLRHAVQIETGAEANEIILINSHDGASSYQLLAGVFRLACHNGLVVGKIVNDIRVAHKGDIRNEVIDGAFRVLDEFEAIESSTQARKALRLEPEEEDAFAKAVLAIRFGARSEGEPPPPITAAQLLEARRAEDLGHDLWTIFQRTAENALRGGQRGRSVKGRRLMTRPVNSIDGSVSLNRALWMLAEETRKLKS